MWDSHPFVDENPFIPSLTWINGDSHVHNGRVEADRRRVRRPHNKARTHRREELELFYERTDD